MDDVAYLVLEDFAAELEGVGANFLGIVVGFVAEKTGKSVLHTGVGLLGEELAGDTGEYGVDGAAASIGEYRLTCEHGLDGGDAEVVLAGEEEGAGMCHEFGNDGITLAAHEFYGGAGEGLEVLSLGALPYYDEAAAELVTQGYGEIDALIPGELADDEEIIFVGGAEFDFGGFDRGIDEIARSAVVLCDAVLDGMAVGDEAVDAMGGRAAPDAGGGEEVADAVGSEPMNALLGEIAVGVVPQEAGGAVAVADVAGSGGGDDAECEGGAAAQNDVVLGKIPRFYGGGDEGQ